MINVVILIAFVLMKDLSFFKIGNLNVVLGSCYPCHRHCGNSVMIYEVGPKWVRSGS